LPYARVLELTALRDQHSSWQQHVGSSGSSRGYGWQWSERRRRVLERDEYLCQPCKRAGRYTIAGVVDHVHNRARGGSDDMSNLEAVCVGCHRIKTGRESHA